MPDTTTTPGCPHCGAPLLPFQLPDNTGWDSPIHFACFSDECPYFQRGWTWMLEHYGVRSSYRYRVDPASGSESPLPVWSQDAIKDRILDAEVIAGDAGDDLSGGKAPSAQRAARSAEGENQSVERTAHSAQGGGRSADDSAPAQGAGSAPDPDAGQRPAAKRRAVRAATSAARKAAIPPRKGKAR